jgi:arylsulfatase A-like enzyme
VSLRLAVAALAAAVPLAAQGAPARPNILFVFTDDHAPHAIGAWGGPLAALDPTPHLDRLAAEGMLFRGSFCTNSVCGPSRAVILTGKHSHLNGFRQNGDRFDGGQQTFPKLLQSAGYATALIGKWHLGTDPQGFDHWDVLPGQGDYYNPVMITAAGRRTVEGYVTDIVTDLAIEWMEEQRDRGGPFLLMCQHKAPHRNWMPPARHLDLYDEVEIPEPATLFDSLEDNASPARHQEMSLERELNLVYDLFVEPGPDWDPKAGRALDGSGFQNLKRMTPAQRTAWDAAFADENSAFRATAPTGAALVRWKYQRYIKNYLRCVRGVDDSVGRLLRYLDEAGLAENTVVVYASDQGFYLGDHGWYDKRWMYEESLRMPLIVRWPGVTARGAVDTHLVQNLDYAETFLEIAGAPIPADMQGRSLVPLLRGEAPADWRDAIYYHYYEFPSVHMVARHEGVRTERHKLIRFYQFGEWELYDLAEDPDELRNVYGDPRYRDVATELAVRLGELRARYGDDSDVRAMPEEWRARFR